MIGTWVHAALEAIAHGHRAVAVSLVGRDDLAGSIGGGVLEHVAIQRARRLIGEGSRASTQLFAFPLGADSQQCCGGVVVLLFEAITPAQRAELERLARAPAGSCRYLAQTIGEPTAARYLRIGDPLSLDSPPAPVSDWWQSEGHADAALVRAGDRVYLCRRQPAAALRVALFGAGHVGRALVDALVLQDCRIDWFDSRPDPFPHGLPSAVRARHCEAPQDEVEVLPPGTHVLVMTHRHPMDYAICLAALGRGDLGRVGLIGSRSKRRRFVRRLIADGLAPSRAEQLICPIGVPGISGKTPAVIAAATVAQVLQWHDAGNEPDRKAGLSEADVEASGIAATW